MVFHQSPFTQERTEVQKGIFSLDMAFTWFCISFKAVDTFSNRSGMYTQHLTLITAQVPPWATVCLTSSYFGLLPSSSVEVNLRGKEQEKPQKTQPAPAARVLLSYRGTNSVVPFPLGRLRLDFFFCFFFRCKRCFCDSFSIKYRVPLSWSETESVCLLEGQDKHSPSKHSKHHPGLTSGPLPSPKYRTVAQPS